MTDVVLVLTTVPEDFDARAMAATLVSAGHAACVSVLPVMHSVYRWQGRVESASERQLLIKTTAGRRQALEAAIAKAHPYDLPEFIVIDVADGSDAYLRWIDELG
jgi:periplasmic divalent cation tolerance protein